MFWMFKSLDLLLNRLNLSVMDKSLTIVSLDRVHEPTCTVVYTVQRGGKKLHTVETPTEVIKLMWLSVHFYQELVCTHTTEAKKKKTKGSACFQKEVCICISYMYVLVATNLLHFTNISVMSGHLTYRT